ncbi:MAG: hypothetical protein IJ193_07065, partial [Bacilli bacterium]|nr:hypothetical protein [Bacilli bacterium]
MRRMDRYLEEENEPKLSRSNKNQELYENIGKNTRYANFTDVTNTNTYDLGNINSNEKTRENYQKMREYNSIMPSPKVKRDLDEFKSIYKVKENRVYDINSVIAEARKNRTDLEKEEKRKLKNDKYNILINLNKDELEEYRRKRKERFTHPDEEELHELIDTIASKTLAGEIDKNTSVDLLSELMATSMMDKVDPQGEDTDELKNTTPVKMSYEDDDIVRPTSSEDTDENIEVKVTVDTTEIPTEEVVEEETVEEADIEEDREEPEEKTAPQKISKEDLDKIQEELEREPIKKEDSSIIPGADEDFYTRSMDLSKEDFEGEMDDGFAEEKMPIGLRILFALILLAL